MGGTMINAIPTFRFSIFPMPASWNRKFQIVYCKLNPKSEYRNPKQIQNKNFKIQNYFYLFGSFEFW
ncbi:MAG: hypothetical protein A2026_07330 [Deltaproteobacteria bacterium RBG_19FT_COMBO_46_12]|nr:MAG: hypothetical protein A2026_07330 [Deltaproteobacteria bacterium RBG_19FT_COMBO_46_12]